MLAVLLLVSLAASGLSFHRALVGARAMLVASSEAYKPPL